MGNGRQKLQLDVMSERLAVMSARTGEVVTRMCEARESSLEKVMWKLRPSKPTGQISR